MNVSIYVACHKEFINPFKRYLKLIGFFKYIEVGAFFHSKHFCNIRDDLGDSISQKNHTYNELTAQYWIWKNDHNSDVVGICHYRRYFKNPKISNRLSAYMKLLKPRNIKRILKDYDYIGIKTGPFEMSCRERIATSISGLRSKDIPIVRQIILNMYGVEYANAFDETMDRNWNYLYNMFIASKKNFDSYSAWLFPLLQEVEKEVNEEELIGQEKRIFGLWGEYLFNVYIIANHYSVYDGDFIYFEI